MKYLFIICLLICMTSCTSLNQRNPPVVEIRGYPPGSSTPLSVGQGVLIDPETILTSAHVVGDDGLRYALVSSSDQPNSLIVGERDTITDRAVLSLRSPGVQLPALAPYTLGETVSVQLIRSGSFHTLTGTLSSLSDISFYDLRRGSISYSGMILSGILLFPGESGAPVYNTRGELIDTVHIASNK